MRTCQFALLLLFTASAFAMDEKKDKPFECRFTDGPITIDGKADEPAWKHAQVIDRFYLPWLGAKARAAKRFGSAVA